MYRVEYKYTRDTRDTRDTRETKRPRVSLGNPRDARGLLFTPKLG